MKLVDKLIKLLTLLWNLALIVFLTWVLYPDPIQGLKLLAFVLTKL